MRQRILGFFVGILMLASATPVLGAELEGWAWGGGDGASTTNGAYPGIGWISLNSKNCDVDGNNLTDSGVCGGDNTAATPLVRYAVTVPDADGLLSGFAWSEYYGWIDFNNAACPAGATPLCNPRRIGNDLFGFARITAIRDAGGNSGGYDGFISLSSANPGLPNNQSYGLTLGMMMKKEFNDVTRVPVYAWSSDLGWIDFSLGGFPRDFKICPDNVSLLEGQTRQLQAYYNPAGSIDCLNPGTFNAGMDANASVTSWTSSVPAVATVSSGGLVTAVSDVSPSTTVTATYPGMPSASVTINVTCAPAQTDAALCATVSGNYCPSDPVPVQTNSCGNPVSCSGTKNCDYNWIEVGG